MSVQVDEELKLGEEKAAQITDDEKEDAKLGDSTPADDPATNKKKKKKKKKPVNETETTPTPLPLADETKLAETVKRVNINQDDNNENNDDEVADEEDVSGANTSAAKKKKKKKNKKKTDSATLTPSVASSTVKTQTYPPSIPVCDLFPDGNFPLGEILEHPIPKYLDRLIEFY